MNKSMMMCTVAFATLTAAAQLNVVPTEEEAAASVLNEGNSARLEALFERASRGGTISIAALGGSITEGAGSKGARNRWTNLVADWFARTFPKAEVKRRNAGIGATGSAFGAFRVSRDIAVVKPDFVLVDFSVNDAKGMRCGETMEGCIRQILKLERDPAVLMVSLLTSGGCGVQDEHLEVARHYQLPQLSIGNVVHARLKRKEIVWSDYSGDSVHPNVEGHRLVAAIVEKFLDRKLADWRAGKRSSAWTFPAKPLFGTTFDFGSVLAPTELKTKENVGFVKGANRERWHSVMAGMKPGDRLVFETDAPTLSMLHWRLHADYGRAKVTVDGKQMAVLEGWYGATWGGYSHTTLIYRDNPGHHIVELEIMNEKDEHSTGHRFELCAVLATEK